MAEWRRLRESAARWRRPCRADVTSNLLENLDRVVAKGIELEMEKRFRNGIDVTYSSTLQENRGEGTGRILTKFSLPPGQA